ncbi:DUF3999 family protein [Mucilaginibacter sabulilitoris]|uniref:DUF3999 family protein n=1 Tax=Mucilaginibacter sabulilitoris TaxID=1173583 RepID=A0ABZ0TP39_9SPHI|nr:DUF3999 family protein [Mucilaginibacter sabulilitoris]WPU94916.1 DUF3999 family protein [Mucilaginibacter sabulilitoris]
MMKQSLLMTKPNPRMSKITCITLLLCALMLPALAQKNFKYQAVLPRVEVTGFYRISLQPALVAKVKADLSDIRIADAKGNFIPYIPAGSLPQKDQKSFVVFNQVDAPLSSDTGTTFIVENKTGLVLDRLWIKLQNTAVQRKVNLVGSDDLKQWFAIQEDIPLQEAVANSEGTYMQSLAFPASSYRYLKILVNDKNKTPIKFLQAGVYTEYAASLNYIRILPVQLARVDSNKTTYVTIKLNDHYQVNKLHIDITSPKYFKRDVEIYQINNKEKQLLAETALNSAKATDLLLSAKTEELLLQINNGDNPPLTIKGVDAYQSDESLISYLDSKETYHLLAGDSSVQAPEYDLKFFADSIRDNTPQISHGDVQQNTAYQIKQAKPDRDYTLFIWIAIIVAAGLLLFLTLKMTKEVGKKAGKE